MLVELRTITREEYIEKCPKGYITHDEEKFRVMTPTSPPYLDVKWVIENKDGRWGVVVGKKQTYAIPIK